MPAKKKKVIRRAHLSPTPPPPDDIPIVDTTQPLAVEQELAQDVESLTVQKAQDLPQEQIFATTSEGSALERSNRRVYIAGIIAFVGIVTTAAGIFVVSITTPANAPSEQNTQEVVVPKQEEVATPTQPPFNRATITFEILNASGVSGAANRAATKIRSLGYTVVLVGNAPTTSGGNTLHLAEKDTASEDQIIKDLMTDFPLSSEVGALTGSTASARLVIGKE